MAQGLTGQAGRCPAVSGCPGPFVGARGHPDKPDSFGHVSGVRCVGNSDRTADRIVGHLPPLGGGVRGVRCPV